MSIVIRLETETAETLPVSVEADADPTGADVEFQLTTLTGRPNAGAWEAGTWGTWDAATSTAPATTPSIGAAGPLVIVQGLAYVLWRRIGSAGLSKVAVILAT